MLPFLYGGKEVSAIIRDRSLFRKDMKKKLKLGLTSQIYILALIAIMIIGLITQFSQSRIQVIRVQKQTGIRAGQAAGEVISSLQEYPAYEWLLDYWIDHMDEMDIEYDAEFTAGTQTEEKCLLFAQRHPDLMLKYCDSAQLNALPPEDQRLYAEIVYSWILTRMNAVRENYDCNYLYCMMTDTDAGPRPFEEEVFLFSAAEAGSVRGREYGQAYVLGVSVSLMEQEETRESIRQAVQVINTEEYEDETKRTVGEDMENAGNYQDYYTGMALSSDGRRAFVIGSTYEVGDVLGEIRQSVLRDTLLSMLFSFLLLNIIVGDIMIYFLKPLKKILQNIRAYTVHKDSRLVEAGLEDILNDRRAFLMRSNEIGTLTRDFVDLTKEMDDYALQIEHATKERERITFELETAAQIQSQMLPYGMPEFADHPEFDLCASMIPAKVVGGDFYDYFMMDDHHLALVMADVADKGIPAALFMAESKALIKSRTMAGEEPAEVLYHVNQQLNENNNGNIFVTVWLAIMDLRTGEGIAANAGHEHPALCRKGEEFKLVIYKHSLVVGMGEGITYKQHSFRLNPGDRLYVYTDGVPEASNEQGERFGNERMLEVLNAGRDKSPEELLEAVGEAIIAFMGNAARFDDTTMMCFDYHGMEEN